MIRTHSLVYVQIGSYERPKGREVAGKLDRGDQRARKRLSSAEKWQNFDGHFILAHKCSLAKRA